MGGFRYARLGGDPQTPGAGAPPPHPRLAFGFAARLRHRLGDPGYGHSSGRVSYGYRRGVEQLGSSLGS